jgi:hypothetical protein
MAADEALAAQLSDMSEAGPMMARVRFEDGGLEWWNVESIAPDTPCWNVKADPPPSVGPGTEYFIR